MHKRRTFTPQAVDRLFAWPGRQVHPNPTGAPGAAASGTFPCKPLGFAHLAAVATGTSAEAPDVTRQPARSVEHAQIFRGAPLLANVDEQAVLALAAMSEPREYAAGQVIFAEGDPGDALHTIVRGSVRIVVVSQTGREATLATLIRGDSLGELALLDGEPRSATAVAMEPTTTLRVARVDFRRWLLERPEIGVAMLETLGQRLRRTNDAVTDLSFLELPQRIAKRVLVLAEMAGGANDGREVRVTQAALASMVGSSREAVNKHLKHFEAAGWVGLRRGVVIVLDAAALEQQF